MATWALNVNKPAKVTSPVYLLDQNKTNIIMTSVISPEVRDKPSNENMTSDVQSYLITNYREALKKGDKSAAKSCLLAARYFSVNDPNVTNEIYIMAKSDGDVGEASKCFANIFNDLFKSSSDNNNEAAEKTSTVEMMTVMNQMKDETRILLNELKSHFLKLKSSPTPAGLGSRQTASVNTSPMLSPRLRISSEDGFASRESISKLDISHLHSSSKRLFYQQLFENLPETTKKDILHHSIETCDNHFERCRLMMLSLSIFRDSISLYGTKLLKTLINLTRPAEEANPDKQICKDPNSSILCHHARSLLVLDAIPMVLSMTSLSQIEIDVNELYDTCLDFYTRYCLEPSAVEYSAGELHDGVKKTITARILGTEQISSLEDATIEDNILITLALLSQKYLDDISDSEVREKLESLRNLIADRKNLLNRFEHFDEVIQNLKLHTDLPDDILFTKDDSSSQPVVTTPPKSRGRPKKSVQPSVIVSLDDEMRKTLLSKAKEARFVFYAIVQHMFVNCASYLRSTRSRILVNMENSLASLIETDLATKSSSQRTSRSRAGQQHQQSVENVTKKHKAGVVDRLGRGYLIDDDSPLNSEQSKMMDTNILTALNEACKCVKFLSSENNKTFNNLWLKFMASNDKTKSQWYQRFSIDSMLLSENFSSAEAIIKESLSSSDDDTDDDIDVKMEQSSSGTTTLTVMTCSRSNDVMDLRKLIQLISCYLQQSNKVETYERIEELMNKMKYCGLFTNNEDYSKGNSIGEYLVELHGPDRGRDNLGFLFFDSLSMMRYCSGILMTILEKYTTCANAVRDSVIGHSIVLSQLDWPKESHTYDQCLTWIRTHKPKSTTPQSLSAATKFTYPEFFHYVKNPNIIEDFMALLCQGYTLDIKGSSTSPNQNGSQNSNSSRFASNNSTSTNPSTRSGKAITTRGVNKSFKEDLKVAMTQQMKSSSVVIPLDMVSEFIQSALLPQLRSES